MEYELKDYDNVLVVDGKVYEAAPAIRTICDGCAFALMDECPLNCTPTTRHDGRDIVWREEGGEK